MIGTWLASIGPITAVITSLYLARKNDKLNLIITSNLIFIIGYFREYINNDNYVCIEVKTTKVNLQPYKISHEK